MHIILLKLRFIIKQTTNAYHQVLAMEWKRVSRKGFRKIAMQRQESPPLEGGFNQEGVERILSIYFSEIRSYIFSTCLVR